MDFANFYDSLDEFLNKLDSTLPLFNLPEKVLQGLTLKDQIIYYMIQHHYYNDLADHWVDIERYEEIQKSTMKDAREKLEKNKHYSSNIKFKFTMQKKIKITSGAIVVCEPHEYSWYKYETDYKSWEDQCKPFTVKNGLWNVLFIEWYNGNSDLNIQCAPACYMEYALVCFHDSVQFYETFNMKTKGFGVGGHSNICVFDLNAYGKIEKLPQSLVNYYDNSHNDKQCNDKQCRVWDNIAVCKMNYTDNPILVTDHGVIVSAPERRGRSGDYNDEYINLSTLWEPFPKLFDPKLNEGFVNPIPNFFSLGCKADIEEIKKIMASDFDIRLSDWNYLLMGASRSMKKRDLKKQMDFTKFLVQHGANDFDEILTSAGFHENMEMIEYAIQNGADYWNAAFRKSCQGGKLNTVKFFLDKGADNYEDGIKNACWRHHWNVIEYLQDRLDGDIICYCEWHTPKKLSEHKKNDFVYDDTPKTSDEPKEDDEPKADDEPKEDDEPKADDEPKEDDEPKVDTSNSYYCITS